jgi:hypothetical protein
MKQLILVMALIFTGMQIQAQVQVIEKKDGAETIINLNEMPELSLIQVVGVANWTGNKVTITIDYGQKKDFRNDSYIVDNETGEKTKFNTMIDAMNYLEKHGWAYLDAYTLSMGNQAVYHYMFKKITPKE